MSIFNADDVAEALSKKLFKGRSPSEDIAISIKQEFLDKKTLEKFINDVLDDRQAKLVRDIDERITHITAHADVLVDTSLERIEATANRLTTNIEESINRAAKLLAENTITVGNSFEYNVKRTGSEVTKGLVFMVAVTCLLLGALIAAGVFFVGR